jgi:hypothetical protein
MSMGLFGSTVGGRVSGGSGVLKNHDSRCVLKNHVSSTKSGGEKKWPGETGKKRSVWRDSYVSPPKKSGKAKPNTAYFHFCFIL